MTEQFFKTLTRKFRKSCKVWLRYCTFKLRGAHPEAAGRTLERALEAIPKRKHVKLIHKVERGEEGMVTDRDDGR